MIDLSFRVLGDRVPRDHGYALYAAICQTLPQLHGAPWLGVHPLSNVFCEGDLLRLGDSAEFRVRIPAERIPEVLGLSGRSLTVAGNSLRLGVPRVHALKPAQSLDARLVALRLTRPPRRSNHDLGRETLDMEAFERRYEAELLRQLAALGVKGGRLSLQGRRTLCVAGRTLIGFSVRVGELDAEGSLLLQETGLGGKRAMGCGLFRPTRGAVPPP